MTRPLLVVKVGGSFLAGAALRPLLAMLAGAERARIVVVPGGGVFADAVRLAQARAGLDDALAHRLALAAMGQMAQVFRALAPGLEIVSSPAQIMSEERSAVVWDPGALRAGHPEIPETWDVTSDSLAAWLATRIGARRLIVLKSAAVASSASLDTLAAQGVVDQAFPNFAARFGGEILVVGPPGPGLAELLSIDEAAPSSSGAALRTEG